MTYEDFIEGCKDVVAQAAINFAREKGETPEEWSLLWDLISEDKELTDFIEWVIANEVGDVWLDVCAADEIDRCLDITQAIFSEIVDQTMAEAFGRLQSVE